MAHIQILQNRLTYVLPRPDPTTRQSYADFCRKWPQMGQQRMYIGWEVQGHAPQTVSWPRSKSAQLGGHAFSRVGGGSPRSRRLNERSRFVNPHHLPWPRCSRSGGQGASSRQAVDLGEFSRPAQDADLQPRLLVTQKAPACGAR